MSISSVRGEEGKVMGYRSSPVYTVVDGSRYLVCEGYEADSISEVCRLAYLNASIRQMVAKLALKWGV